MLRGHFFKVHYRLSGLQDEAAARAAAQDIALEQTVELPEELVTSQAIRQDVVGQIESLEHRVDHTYEAVIRYTEATTGNQLPQLLNVLFGNISIKPNIRLEKLEIPEGLFQSFRGPRFGVEGLRKRLGVPARPLLCTALKPMGLNASQLADMAYRFALGGIDLIKDDHGLADQPFARFDERVKRCADAVARANRETGGHSVYLPNVSLPNSDFLGSLRLAKAAGAGGFLISPGLTGFDAMRLIAENDDLDLPVLMHPALLGSFVTNPSSGISHFALFGQLARLAGADGSIFPSFGGRFSFSRSECSEIAEGCTVPMSHFKRIFPVPGGGMSLEKVPEMLSVYGRDVIFLVGGALFRKSPDWTANARYFRTLVESPTPIRIGQQ